MIHCKSCRREYEVSSFINSKGRQLKTCQTCLMALKKRRDANKQRNKCEHCGKGLQSHCALIQHIKAVHDKIKDYKCDQCDATFSSIGKKDRHIDAVHDKIKNCECDRCGAWFYSNSHLEIHIKAVHDKIKDYKCDRCDASFSSIGKKYRHVKAVHDKIKDYKCDQCLYVCAERCILRHHVKVVHDKIKDHKCDQCPYSAATAYRLKRHQKICTGVLNKSGGEFAVMKVLDLQELEYKDEYSFNKCRGTTGTLLRFDFYIPSLNICIEFDGKQHYIPVRFGGISHEAAVEALATCQKNDQIKNEYCEANDIPLLRIPYMRLDEVQPLILEFIDELPCLSEVV